MDSIIEDLDWYISQAGDDIHLIEKFEAEDSYDLYEALELDELAAPGPPPVVKGHKKLDVSFWLEVEAFRPFVQCAMSRNAVVMEQVAACFVCSSVRSNEVCESSWSRRTWQHVGQGGKKETATAGCCLARRTLNIKRCVKPLVRC